MATKAIRYVTQDGAYFHIWRDAAMSDFQTVWTAPIQVGDFDMRAAEKAREACVNQLKFAGYEIEWPNPFGDS